MTRYDGRRIVRNQELSYSDVLQNRELTHIDQYETPTFMPVRVADGLTVTKIQHVWAFGDRLWKLADRYYGDSTYWWVIAWYNQKPTESHFSVGSTVIIPTPLEVALTVFSRKE